MRTDWKQNCNLALKAFRILPLYRLYRKSENRELIRQDMEAWKKIKGLTFESEYRLFHYLMLNTEAFRNIYLYRIEKSGFLIRKLVRPMDTLIIGKGQVGGGLYIQHGFATIIAAKSIGENCWFNQQVTVGFEQDRQPVIGNHVRVCAGAIIIGDVTIGDNAIIAAGAVVTKNVPANEVWGGNPAHFIKKVTGSAFDDQRETERERK